MPNITLGCFTIVTTQYDDNTIATYTYNAVLWFYVFPWYYKKGLVLAPGYGKGNTNIT